MAAEVTAYTGFHQLKVKAWLRSRDRIELILCFAAGREDGQHNGDADDDATFDT
jgi:hypothetical protein